MDSANLKTTWSEERQALRRKGTLSILPVSEEYDLHCSFGSGFSIRRVMDTVNSLLWKTMLNHLEDYGGMLL